jgi:hypothetical protein
VAYDLEKWIAGEAAFFERRHVAPFREAVAMCESPIEKAVLYALVRVYGFRMAWRWPTISCGLPGTNGDGRLMAVLIDERHLGSFVHRLHLYPQVTITTPGGQPYRLDFVLHLEVLDRENQKAHVNSVLIDVECDGHDFHERTKEQAERDRRRDREVQQVGYFVARFTGAEIAREPELVAMDLVGMAARLDEAKRRP